jgi:hypothetical protein
VPLAVAIFTHTAAQRLPIVHAQYLQEAYILKMNLLDYKKHLFILIPLFLFIALSLTWFDTYWKIAIVLAIASFFGCILIGTLVFIRSTESTGQNARLRSLGTHLKPVEKNKATIGSIISNVEKILLFYCLTIIAGFFLSVLLFLLVNT